MERWYKGVQKSALSKIPNFSLSLKYVINVCTMNTFRYTFVQKRLYFPTILLLNILNYITYKALPFNREKHGAGICSSIKLCSGLGLRSR